MDGDDHTVSAVQKLCDACEEVILFKLSRKHRRDLYSRILWSELLMHKTTYALVLTACAG